MKAIPESAYKNLTMSQRFRTAIAADGRNDQTEIKRLMETSDAGDYAINKLQARLTDFTAMTLAINLDLMSCQATWLLAQKCDGFDEGADPALAGKLLDQSLTNCASIVAARNQWLEKLGVSLEDFNNYNSAIPLLDEFIQRAEGKQDPALTADALDQIMDFFKGRYSN
jgi:hypothetical protein